MFNSINNLIKATTSLVSTNSGRLFGQSADYAASASNDLVSASASQAQALVNVASGAAKIAATGAAVGAGIMAFGSAIGVGVTASGALGVANYVLHSAAIAALQNMVTEATVFVVRNSTAATVGSGAFHTLLNGKLLMEGISEVCSAAKNEFDAVSYLTKFAAKSVASAGYTVSGTAVKGLEILDKFVGSDQDGMGEKTNISTLTVNLADTDIDLIQREEKLSEDKAALDKAIAVNQEAILKLTGGNEITKSAKSGYKVVEDALAAQEAYITEETDKISQEKDMLAEWNIVEKADILSGIGMIDVIGSDAGDFVTVIAGDVDLIDLSASAMAA